VLNRHLPGHQLASRIALVVIGLTLCGCNQRSEVEARISEVGVDALESAAASLRTDSGVKANVSLPKASWPATIAAFNPEAVTIAREGVFLMMESRFTSESGVFIAFDGVRVPTGSGQDPSFEQLQGRVYWYRIEG
jgi:hypothetical protein